jgi:hypothetical protein
MLDHYKVPSSPYWECWEHLGTFQIPSGSEKFYNTTDGDTIIASLEKAHILAKDSAFQADIAKMQDLVRKAVAHHDLSKFVELHAMLHDYDYWIVNYPIYYPKIAPSDWSGVKCYFGVINSIKYTD